MTSILRVLTGEQWGETGHRHIVRQETREDWDDMYPKAVAIVLCHSDDAITATLPAFAAFESAHCHYG
jgi:hypothetical protein